MVTNHKILRVLLSLTMLLSYTFLSNRSANAATLHYGELATYRLEGSVKLSPPFVSINNSPEDAAQVNTHKQGLFQAATRVIDGCTPAPYGSVCVQVDGTPGTTYVARVGVSRLKASWSMICDYGGRVYINDSKGKTLWTQALNRKECAVGRAWFTWNVNRSFPSGSKVCARFREYGVQQGGEPCLTLKQK